ncbi:MAG: hypothetical protein WC378_04045, partial [Opitutaceae bacterium]
MPGLISRFPVSAPRQICLPERLQDEPVLALPHRRVVSEHAASSGHFPSQPVMDREASPDEGIRPNRPGDDIRGPAPESDDERALLQLEARVEERERAVAELEDRLRERERDFAETAALLRAKEKL